MTIYHKLIKDTMLNNYDLDMTLEEALKAGYKPLKEDEREEGKEYEMSYKEYKNYIRRVWTEIEPSKDINNDTEKGE